MLNKKAESIAKEFLSKMNPSLWDGYGAKPENFMEIIWEYPLTNDIRLDISFQYDEEDGWLHCCELVDSNSDEMLEILSGYGIDSVFNISDTIMDICKCYM